jgi:hypothetical protein
VSTQRRMIELELPVTIRCVSQQILLSGFGGRKAPSSMGKIKTAEVLRLRATSTVSRNQSVRRSAQDDDSVAGMQAKDRCPSILVYRAKHRKKPSSARVRWCEGHLGKWAALLARLEPLSGYSCALLRSQSLHRIDGCGASCGDERSEYS